MTGPRVTKFVPRGMNYVRIGPQTAPDGTPQTYHSTFDPGKYDGAGVEAALERMHVDGYNVVRVFVSQNTIGTADDGLSQPYMQNVADFLARAKQNQIYVMITQDWFPGGRYGQLIGQGCCDQFNFNNAQNLPPAAVEAYQAYYADFITELLNLKAATDAIFSYELRNEYFFDTDYPPFTLDSGTVTTANGKTYDMSSAADKQKMAEENLPYFIDQVRASILQLDPTALVSVGFFQPQSPNPTRVGDARLAVTARPSGTRRPISSTCMPTPTPGSVSSSTCRTSASTAWKSSRSSWASLAAQQPTSPRWILRLKPSSPGRANLAPTVSTAGCSGPGIPRSSPTSSMHFRAAAKSSRRSPPSTAPILAPSRSTAASQSARLHQNSRTNSTGRLPNRTSHRIPALDIHLATRHTRVARPVHAAAT